MRWSSSVWMPARPNRCNRWKTALLSVASNLLDFTDLLQRSWGSRKAAKPQAAAPVA